MGKRRSDMVVEMHTLRTGLLGKAEGPTMSVSRSSTRTMTASPTAWDLVSISERSYQG